MQESRLLSPYPSQPGGHRGWPEHLAHFQIDLSPPRSPPHSDAARVRSFGLRSQLDFGVRRRSLGSHRRRSGERLCARVVVFLSYKQTSKRSRLTVQVGRNSYHLPSKKLNFGRPRPTERKKERKEGHRLACCASLRATTDRQPHRQTVPSGESTDQGSSPRSP